MANKLSYFNLTLYVYSNFPTSPTTLINTVHINDVFFHFCSHRQAHQKQPQHFNLSVPPPTSTSSTSQTRLSQRCYRS